MAESDDVESDISSGEEQNRTLFLKMQNLNSRDIQKLRKSMIEMNRLVSILGLKQEASTEALRQEFDCRMDYLQRSMEAMVQTFDRGMSSSYEDLLSRLNRLEESISSERSSCSLTRSSKTSSRISSRRSSKLKSASPPNLSSPSSSLPSYESATSESLKSDMESESSGSAASTSVALKVSLSSSYKRRRKRLQKSNGLESFSVMDQTPPPLTLLAHVDFPTNPAKDTLINYIQTQKIALISSNQFTFCNDLCQFASLNIHDRMWYCFVGTFNWEPAADFDISETPYFRFQIVADSDRGLWNILLISTMQESETPWHIVSGNTKNFVASSTVGRKRQAICRQKSGRGTVLFRC